MIRLLHVSLHVSLHVLHVSLHVSLYVSLHVLHVSLLASLSSVLPHREVLPSISHLSTSVLLSECTYPL